MGNEAPAPIPRMKRDAAATENFHYFTAAAYFFPFGALLATFFLGKYKKRLVSFDRVLHRHPASRSGGAPSDQRGLVAVRRVAADSRIVREASNPASRPHVGDNSANRINTC